MKPDTNHYYTCFSHLFLDFTSDSSKSIKPKKESQTLFTIFGYQSNNRTELSKCSKLHDQGDKLIIL